MGARKGGGVGFELVEPLERVMPLVGGGGVESTEGGLDELEVGGGAAVFFLDVRGKSGM
jgi:hypothetical protein